MAWAWNTAGESVGRATARLNNALSGQAVRLLETPIVR